MAGLGLPPMGAMPPMPEDNDMDEMGGMMPPQGMMAEPPLSAVFPMATPAGAEQLLAMFEQQKAAEHDQLSQMQDEVGMMLMQGLQTQLGGGMNPVMGYAEGAAMNTVGNAPAPTGEQELPPELAALLMGGQIG